MPDRKLNLPPNDVEPTELFLKLMERPRPSEVVDLPRKNEDGSPVGQVRLQVLTLAEQMQANYNALKRCKDDFHLSKADLEIGFVEESLLGTRAAAEILALSCVGVDGHETPDGKKIYPYQFANAEQVEKAFAPNEQGALFAAYTLVQKKFGPTAADILTDGELNAWIRRLVEGGTAIPFAYKDWGQLVDLLTHLTSRVFVLSHILESQLSRLPDTLTSRLGMWGIGTGYWSLPEESDTSPEGEDHPSSNGSPDSHSLVEPDEAEFSEDRPPVTIEDAISLARQVTANG